LYIPGENNKKKKREKDEGVWGPLDEAGVMELKAAELLV
jgi:hypothetical protein